MGLFILVCVTLYLSSKILTCSDWKLYLCCSKILMSHSPLPGLSAMFNLLHVECQCYDQSYGWKGKKGQYMHFPLLSICFSWAPLSKYLPVFPSLLPKYLPVLPCLLRPLCWVLMTPGHPAHFLPIGHLLAPVGSMTLLNPSVIYLIQCAHWVPGHMSSTDSSVPTSIVIYLFKCTQWLQYSPKYMCYYWLKCAQWLQCVPNPSDFYCTCT